jgi:hypothetical protein
MPLKTLGESWTNSMSWILSDVEEQEGVVVLGE